MRWLNVYIGDSPLHEGRATFRLGDGWDALNADALRAGVSDPAAQDRFLPGQRLADDAGEESRGRLVRLARPHHDRG